MKPFDLLNQNILTNSEEHVPETCFLQAISNFVPVFPIQNRSQRFEATDFPEKWK